MATTYICKNSGPAAHKRFLALRECLGWESYPNGNAGHQDRMAPIFEACGYTILKGYGGSPAMMASWTFRGENVLPLRECVEIFIARLHPRYDECTIQRLRALVGGDHE